AAVALAGCLSYAEMGVNLPRSGGEYVYLREAWGPAWGFLSGWVSFFAGFSAPIAAGALAVSRYLAVLFPVLAQRPPLPGGLSLDWARLVSVAIILALAAVNIRGVGSAGKLQNLLTGITLVSIAAFLVLAFTLGRGDWSHFAMPVARTSVRG